MARLTFLMLVLCGFLVMHFPAQAAVLYLSEGFDTNNAGWTLDTTWQIGVATASSGEAHAGPDPGTDHTATLDNGVAGVIIGGNAPTSPTHGFYYLTSPSVNTTGASAGLSLEFYRWLNSDFTPYMNNQVQVFNGSVWTTLWETGTVEVKDTSWVRQNFNIFAYSNANLKVRFGYDIGSNGTYNVSSWNLDDVAIYSDSPTGVPEPGTWFPLAGGLLAFAGLRKRFSL